MITGHVLASSPQLKHTALAPMPGKQRGDGIIEGANGTSGGPRASRLALTAQRVNARYGWNIATPHHGSTASGAGGR
jgi:hypothetical protein